LGLQFRGFAIWGFRDLGVCDLGINIGLGINAPIKPEIVEIVGETGKRRGR